MKEETYAPLPYVQVTDVQTGMWIRGYIGQDGSQLRAELNKRKEQLSVPSWREYHNWRLQ